MNLLMKTGQRKGVPLTLTEELNEYICLSCWSEGLYMFLIEGKCIRCGNGVEFVREDVVLGTEYEPFVERLHTSRRMYMGHQLELQAGSATKLGLTTQQYIEQQHIIKMEAEKIASSMLIPKTIEGDTLRMASAMMLAEASNVTGLFAPSREIMVANFGSKNYPDVQLIVGYPGYRHIAIRACGIMGEKFSFDPLIYMGADEVIAQRANICPTCRGSTVEKYWENQRQHNRPCTRCGAKGSIDPARMLVGTVALRYGPDYRLAQETGGIYHPETESAVWYEWESWPAARTPGWLVKKRAQTGALRLKFSWAMVLQLHKGPNNEAMNVAINAVDDEFAFTIDRDENVIEGSTFDLRPDKEPDEDAPSVDPFLPLLDPGAEITPEVVEEGKMFAGGLGYDVDKIPKGGTVSIFEMFPGLVFGNSKTWSTLKPLEFYNLMVFLTKASMVDAEIASKPEDGRRAVAMETGKALKDQLKALCVSKSEMGEPWKT